MLESKKYIYDNYKDSVIYIAESEEVTIDVAVDMMVANLAKIADLITNEVSWYHEPITLHMYADYERYLDLIRKEEMVEKK